MVTRQPTPVEVLIGWTFEDDSLLWKALTHSTYANENPDAGSDYERLEFVGDAVLDLLTAHLLFDTFKSAPEGELSRRRARVVRRETLAALAEQWGLGEHIRLGAGQLRAAGGSSKRILADTFEAVAGAVYLDGGYEAAARCFTQRMTEAIAAASAPVDFKTRLQEACHRLGLSAPLYNVVTIEGPDHARQFTCEVMVGETSQGRGVGTSKKTAEQVCAHEALANLGVKLET